MWMSKYSHCCKNRTPGKEVKRCKLEIQSFNVKGIKNPWILSFSSSFCWYVSKSKETKQKAFRFGTYFFEIWYKWYGSKLKIMYMYFAAHEVQWIVGNPLLKAPSYDILSTLNIVHTYPTAMKIWLLKACQSEEPVLSPWGIILRH